MHEDGLGVYSAWQSYEVNIVYVSKDWHRVGHSALKLPFSTGIEKNVSFEDNYGISKRKHLAWNTEKYNLTSITS